MEEKDEKTVYEMLDGQIKETLDDIELARFSDQDSVKPLLEKLKVLQTQQLEIRKAETDASIRTQELALDNKRFEADVESKKRERELEEQKQKEQKKTNLWNTIFGGIGAFTGLAGLALTMYCFKKSLVFEETGSYTSKTQQHIGGLINLFRKK